MSVPDEYALYADPALYDRLVSPPGASAAFYLAEARASGGPVLELACGTGRLTIPIARGLAVEGVADDVADGIADVVGLDLAPAMVEAARRKAAAAGVALDLGVADMRVFDLGRRFGTIFVGFNALLHLHTRDDFAACFACVRRHLAPGGAFAFDVFNPSVRLLARAPGERVTVSRVPDAALGEIHIEATSDYDAATQVNRGAWHLSAPGRPDFRTLPLHLRSVFPQELPLLLAASGLRLDARYGDFGREPFTGASPRQVCVCRAP